MTKSESIIFLIMCIGAAMLIPFSTHKESTQLGAMAYLQLPTIALLMGLVLYRARKKRLGILSICGRLAATYVIATTATNGLILVLRLIR
jgi:carbon starvation protein CstA